MRQSSVKVQKISINFADGSEDEDSVKPEIMEEYEKLKNKCDDLIYRIKIRRQKKKHG